MGSTDSIRPFPSPLSDPGPSVKEPCTLAKARPNYNRIRNARGYQQPLRPMISSVWLYGAVHQVVDAPPRQRGPDLPLKSQSRRHSAYVFHFPGSVRRSLVSVLFCLFILSYNTIDFCGVSCLEYVISSIRTGNSPSSIRPLRPGSKIPQTRLDSP